MAKIVISGCSDCPYYAKVEILAEKLSINVPNFFIHKIVKQRNEWEDWVNYLINSNQWHVKESPIIWRELVDRGGKGSLIGGANEFQEYIKCYYDIVSDLTSQDMQDIALDNIKFKDEEDKENREFKALSMPTKICICGSLNAAVPHFVLDLASGNIIGKSTELSIVFFDKPYNIPFLKSLQIGTFDLAYPLVRSISITEDPEAALTESLYVIIFDEVTQSPIESRDEWLLRCQETYEYIGNLLEKYCPINVKVLHVPCGETNLLNVGLTCIHRMLNTIPRFNVIGLSRPFEQHARSVLAKKLNVNPSNVHNIIIWGNIGGKKVLDIANCRVHKYDGAIVGPEPFSLLAEKTIWDKKWLSDEMEKLIQGRFETVNELGKGRGSPLAIANAVCTFMRQWINGDQKGYVHSLTVASEGSYGIPEGMVFSMPVIFSPKGFWHVVQDIEMTEMRFKIIKECIQDINEQLGVIYPWMINNQADMIMDEAFIDGQMRALLKDEFSEEWIEQIRSVFSRFLSLEERLEVSRSRELLLKRLSEIEKVEKLRVTTQSLEQNENNEYFTVGRNSVDGNNTDSSNES